MAEAGAAAVIMTYWNPVERYGVERFAADLAAAGGSGAITPDLIPDEAQAWLAASDEHGLDRVFLVAPVVDRRPDRLDRPAPSRGFVYAAAVMGVTGARASVGDAAASPGRPGARARRRRAGVRRARRVDGRAGRRRSPRSPTA